MNDPFVSVNLIVRDGEKYIRKCLKAVFNQDFKNYEVLVFDNKSGDRTREIVEKEFPGAKLIKFEKNYGLGGGFNKSLQYSNSQYVVLLCVDVILASNFLSEAVKALEVNSKIGVFQPKVLVWDIASDKFTDVIDTTGFEIFKSRRIINRGHGERHTDQYQEGEVFSYEGACPVFRREALEEAKMPFNDNEYLDEDFEWYADDIDLGWRMRILGWQFYFQPNAIAYHDRKTTKRLKKNLIDFIKLRKTVSAQKRMLDFRNQRLTMIKNEFALHLLKDFPFFFFREIKLLIYFLIFERNSLAGISGLFKLLPKMLKKRKWIMKRKKISKREIERWFK